MLHKVYLFKTKWGSG